MRHRQTLTFAALIISSQAGVYLLRERGHFWESRPSRFLIGSTLLGLTCAAFLSLSGVVVPAIQPWMLLAVTGMGAVYFRGLDWVKVRLFAWLQLR